MEEQGHWEEVKNLFIKVLIPALIGVSIRLAITSKKQTMSVFNIIASVVVGCGVAWLFSGIIMDNFSEQFQPLIIALMAISGEKIATWVIYKWNVDKLIDSLIDWYRK